jgi:NitT/TauT family transport system substrate-binding protein
MIQATAFGRSETEKASAMLRQTANLDAKDATSYAKLWDEIYIASMEAQDVATFKAMAQIFKAGKTLEGEVPDSIYATAPYEKAKRQP